MTKIFHTVLKENRNVKSDITFVTAWHCSICHRKDKYHKASFYSNISHGLILLSRNCRSKQLINRLTALLLIRFGTGFVTTSCQLRLGITCCWGEKTGAHSANKNWLRALTKALGRWGQCASSKGMYVHWDAPVWCQCSFLALDEWRHQ